MYRFNWKRSQFPSITHNPCNIKYNNNNVWIGQVGVTWDGFCVFKHDDYGIRAGFIILFQSFGVHNNKTVESLIKHWSGLEGEALDRYVSFMCTHLGCEPHLTLSFKNINTEFMSVLITYEGNMDFTDESAIHNGYFLALDNIIMNHVSNIIDKEGFNYDRN